MSNDFMTNGNRLTLDRNGLDALECNQIVDYNNNYMTFSNKKIGLMSIKIKITVLCLINHLVGYPHFFRICFFTAGHSRALLEFRTGWSLYCSILYTCVSIN